MANIREQVSWVTTDKVEATKKAKALVAAAVGRVAWHQPLEPLFVPDRLQCPGGRRRASPASRPRSRSPTPATTSTWWSASRPSAATWPSSTRPSPPWTARPASSRPRCSTSATTRTSPCCTWSEVEKVDGYIGNFTVTIRKRARYIDEGAVHRLRRVPGEMPEEGGRRRLRGRRWATARRSTAPSPRPFPTTR